MNQVGSNFLLGAALLDISSGYVDIPQEDGNACIFTVNTSTYFDYSPLKRFDLLKLLGSGSPSFD